MTRLLVLAALAAAVLAGCQPASTSGPTSCEPSCTGRECGSDGCGGSCGTCAAGSTCDGTFRCAALACTPACAGKECGDDGCGGSCGACANGAACGTDGRCEAPPPPPLPPSPACGGGALHCTFEAHTAYEYGCVRDAGGAWDCQRTGYIIDWIPGSYEGAYANYQACRIACAGGNSSCGHTDVDYVVECQRCEESCVPVTYTEACRLETADACPFPCGCR